MASGRLVGFLFTTAARHNPTPTTPTRPLVCPRCASTDVHGARPCPRRADLDNDPKKRRHDWHCHACRWSARIGDRGY